MKNKIASMFVVLAILLVLEIILGSTWISADLVFEAMFSPEHPLAPIAQTRFNSALGATLAGAGLGICGLSIQTFFRNPLAGPSVLGVSTGASLGVALLVLISGSFGMVWTSMGVGASFAMAIAALVGGMTVLALLLLLSKKISSNVSLLIFGLMLGYITGALVSVLQTQAQAENIKSLVMWGMGNFSDLYSGELVLMLLVVLLGSVILYMRRSALDAWLFGSQYAFSMGVDVKQLRWIMLGSVGLIVGVITAFCGPIAFIGLSTPHLTRGLFGKGSHSQLIPLTLLVGAVLAIFCDLLSRLPGIDYTLPLNAVTCMIGAPLIIWVILKGRRIHG
ncbi:MAG: iron chelate uptake ABC transporter family permease subunit [Flavobacteriales bacterium]